MFKKLFKMTLIALMCASCGGDDSHDEDTKETRDIYGYEYDAAKQCHHSQPIKIGEERGLAQGCNLASYCYISVDKSLIYTITPCSESIYTDKEYESCSAEEQRGERTECE
jgi:hypothetical protein